MATNIRPDALDNEGLTPLHARIGINVPNARVYVTNFNYYFTQDMITFEALTFYNNAALQAYIVDKSVEPFKTVEYYTIYGIDPNKSLVNQCLDYLLTLPPYNGSQLNTLPWIRV